MHGLPGADPPTGPTHDCGVLDKSECGVKSSKALCTWTGTCEDICSLIMSESECAAKMYTYDPQGYLGNIKMCTWYKGKCDTAWLSLPMSFIKGHTV